MAATIAQRERGLKVEKLEAEVEKPHAEARKLSADAAEKEANAREEKASLDTNRVYHFNEGVNDDSVPAAIETLDFWSRRDPRKDIQVVLTTPGGSFFQSVALFDFITELRDRGHKVTTTAYGMALSAGALLLQAGTERVMGRNAWLMVHEASGHFWEETLTTSVIEDEASLLRGITDHYFSVVASRSRLTVGQIRERAERKDWWVRAEQALELGLVDAIAP